MDNDGTSDITTHTYVCLPPLSATTAERISELQDPCLIQVEVTQSNCSVMDRALADTREITLKSVKPLTSL